MINFVNARTGIRPLTCPLVVPLTQLLVGGGRGGAVEQLLDPNFTDTAFWTEGVGWAVAGGVCTATSAATGTFVDCLVADRIIVSTGEQFLWEIVVDSITAGGFALAASSVWGVGPTLSTPGTHTGTVTASADATGVALRIRAVGTTSGVLSRFSFKRIPK